MPLVKGVETGRSSCPVRPCQAQGSHRGAPRIPPTMLVSARAWPRVFFSHGTVCFVSVRALKAQLSHGCVGCFPAFGGLVHASDSLEQRVRVGLCHGRASLPFTARRPCQHTRGRAVLRAFAMPTGQLCCLILLAPCCTRAHFATTAPPLFVRGAATGILTILCSW